VPIMGGSGAQYRGISCQPLLQGDQVPIVGGLGHIIGGSGAHCQVPMNTPPAAAAAAAAAATAATSAADAPEHREHRHAHRLETSVRVVYLALHRMPRHFVKSGLIVKRLLTQYEALYRYQHLQ